jgi:hypothetical protein
MPRPWQGRALEVPGSSWRPSVRRADEIRVGAGKIRVLGGFVPSGRKDRAIADVFDIAAVSPLAKIASCCIVGG